MQKLLVPLYHNELQGRGSKVIKKNISTLQVCHPECHRFKFCWQEKYFLLEVACSFRNLHGLRSKCTSILPSKIRTLFTTIKTWRQPKSPWMDKQLPTQLMEDYSAWKGRKLTRASSWVNLEDVTVAVKCSSHKQTNVSESTSYGRYVEQSNSHTQKVEWWLPGTGGQGRRRGSGGLAFNRFRVSVWDKKVLEMDSGDG